MSAFHPDVERLARAAALLPGDVDGHRHLACEILAQLPLVRAIARVRCPVQAEADALAKATLQRALGEPIDRVPAADVRPWLLGLQRALYAARDGDEAATTVADPPARGANATWRRLHEALLGLPDRQREALVLADGAYCAPADLAAILECGTEQACRLVRHARAALLARLDMAQRRSVPTVRPAAPRRPAAPSRPWRKEPSRPIGAGSSASRPAVDLVDDRHGFARRLNDALFRALRQEAAEPADRRSFAALVAGPAGPSGGLGEGGHGPSGRLSRTSWLRLMFVAYACTDQPAPTGQE